MFFVSLISRMRSASVPFKLSEVGLKRLNLHFRKEFVGCQINFVKYVNMYAMYIINFAGQSVLKFYD